MTRFARAKGSKSSNERVPDDATPWHVMKQQLDEKLTTVKETEKIKSVKELLDNEKDLFYSDTVGNVNHDWAEFEDNNCNTVQVKNNSKEIRKKQNKPTKKCKDFKQVEEHTQTNTVQKTTLKRKMDVTIDDSATTGKVKKHKKGKNHPDNVNTSSDNNVDSNKNENEKNKSKKKKHSVPNENALEKNHVDCEDNISSEKKKIKKRIAKNTNNEENNSNVSESDKKENSTEAPVTLSKRQKRNLRKKFKKPDENDESSGASKIIENDSNTSVSQEQNRPEANRYNKQNSNKKFADNKFGNKRNENKTDKRKLPKVRDDQEHKRRKPDLGPTKVTINGVEVEIVKFNGFPVRKEDADRLSDLKQKMIIKGIPKKEIDAALKLERRKAEKALARIKKCVCFHCRKSGHNLSDCPELGSEQAGTGICFKCGSTEHTHFECKVAKPTEYRYATCFICREQGHIAKQCPDNPKGIYPQGGACKICGDVTHLKKDCPDLAKDREEATMTVNTIGNGTLESLEEDAKTVQERNNDNTSMKKVVKF